MNADLAAVLRIKRMAEAAAAPAAGGRSPTAAEAVEMVAAYERLRQQARELTRRAGWSVDDFDAELPALSDAEPVARANRATSMAAGGVTAFQAVSRGLRVSVLLGLLSAWAAGYQEVFELDGRFEADAKVKAEQARRGPTGFTG